MQEKSLYKVISEGMGDSEFVLFTALDGSTCGRKALFCGGELVWSNMEDKQLSAVENKLLPYAAGGIVKLDGEEYFCEPFASKPELLICGAGHVALALVKLAAGLEFGITVIDDRQDFADRARLSGADRVICANFEEALEALELKHSTYAVIMTRGHQYDLSCLEQLLKRNLCYVGMMGSRRRIAMIKAKLAEEGFSQEKIDGVHMPIGLSIAAQTPEEIAVSVAAQLIQKKNEIKRTPGYTGEILNALTDVEKNKSGAVLAVIISRKGSAPREVGTKMIIYRDGNTVGTIGGGCMEGDVIRTARWILAGTIQSPRILEVELVSDDAGSEEMACGGVVRVLLERV